MLPSYCDALTGRWQSVAPAGGRLTVMQGHLNTALPVTVLCMGWSLCGWFIDLRVVHWPSVRLSDYRIFTQLS